MDSNQPPELQDNTTSSLLEKANEVTPFSKYTALALFVILPFLGFWFGLQQIPATVTNPVPSAVTTTENVQSESTSNTSISKQADRGVEYQNSDYGFSLTLPDALATIGFFVEDTPSGKGMDGRQVNMYAQGIDPVSGEMSLHSVSNIGIYPISGYVTVTCEDPDGPCYPGVELGRNNKYVFVSEYFSPESYGACYDVEIEGESKQLSGLFYESNTALCSDDSIRYPEKREGSFSVFEVR
jgi:hypothetical protein